MEEEIRRLAAAQHAVFARRQVLALGATPAFIANKLRTGEWRAPRRGVYRINGAPITERSEVMAAVLACGPDAVASHEVAAALHGVPGFGLRPVTLVVPVGRARVAPGVVAYRSTELPPTHRCVLDGIPSTSAARTLFDLCGRAHPRRAERALDTALARGITDLGACWRVLLDLAEHGRNGTVVMRNLLEERRSADGVGPESEIEDRFVRLLRRNHLPMPERQVDLGDEHGWIGRVDFYFRPVRLVVETDGWPWHRSKLDREADARRDARLEASGRRVMRLVWSDVTEREPMTVVRLRAALSA